MLAVFLACAALAACAPAPKPPTAAEALKARETAAVDRLKLREHYKDAVLGYDVNGTTLNLYVDRNTVESMDEQSEDAMLAAILNDWTSIWKSTHRGRHARLHLSARDYYGNELSTKSAAV